MPCFSPPLTGLYLLFYLLVLLIIYIKRYGRYGREYSRAINKGFFYHTGVWLGYGEVWHDPAPLSVHIMGFTTSETCYCVRMKTKYARRWRGRTKKEVSTAMKALAKARVGKMTKEERSEHGRIMAAGRGSWQEVDGNRVFIKREKAGNV